jgi:hypothetical protein
MMGVILTRYGQPERTVVAGILSDAVEDAVGERQLRETLEQRIGQKFGSDVLDIALVAVPRSADEDGLEFAHEERRDDFLERLAGAGEPARWVCASGALYECSAIAANLRRTIDRDSVWSGLPLGRKGTIRWYRRLVDRLHALGFAGSIMRELSEAVAELEQQASASE